jgi:hypothetical protein
MLRYMTIRRTKGIDVVLDFSVRSSLCSARSTAAWPNGEVRNQLCPPSGRKTLGDADVLELTAIASLFAIIFILTARG